jgi:homopolymeric O-antigen transport system ATP-binding protein
MGNTVIRAEKLGKRYEIGPLNSSPDTIRDSIASLLTAPFRKGKENGRTSFWALKDATFEVNRGDVVGIIGRNGAGKSTLLKILSRITEPTEGAAEILGRVGSLMEVGTGFHPELSGRDNIYLNGAILGMTRAEISRKFEEIIAFSEVEKFLDTPVKHYSSGMYVRLAFAVAAHLEPEILLVDEVLAVGDAAFQRKCLGKLSDVAGEGRTILFVSHNLTAVQNLCNKAYFLESGKLAASGSVREAIQNYLESQAVDSESAFINRGDRHGSGKIRVKSLTVTSLRNPENGLIMSDDSLKIKIMYEGPEEPICARFRVGIYDLMNTPLFLLDSQTSGDFKSEIRGKGTVVCETDSLNVSPGLCYVNVSVLVDSKIVDRVTQAVVFNVEPCAFYSNGRSFDRRESLFLLRQRWYRGEAKA